jgi:hypothetical protein
MTTIRTGDLVEAVGVILDVDIAEADGRLRGNMAAQFVNAYRGMPMRVRAVQGSYILLKHVATRQRIFADLHLVQFRRRSR